MVDQLLATFGTYQCAGRDSPVCPSRNGSDGGDIRSAPGQLDQKRLNSRTLRFHPDPVVQVKLKRIGGQGNISQPDRMNLDRYRLFLLFQIKSRFYVGEPPVPAIGLSDACVPSTVLHFLGMGSEVQQQGIVNWFPRLHSFGG